MFLGCIGGQYFYLGHSVRGVLSVLFAWTFIPLVIAFFDLFLIRGYTRRLNMDSAEEIAERIRCATA